MANDTQTILILMGMQVMGIVVGRAVENPIELIFGTAMFWIFFIVGLMIGRRHK